MTSRRVFPLSVDASASSSSVNRSQPPPPKSPVHRTPTGNGFINDVARPPTGGSVGYVGFDRLMMMRQVNAAAAPPAMRFMTSGGDEASAAVNHRQRMAAEQQRRQETALMTKEDYTGTAEGQERLQRQEERSRMKEEELLVVRLVEAEKQAARALQREKELEEEKRVKEQYLAKIRAQREQQEREAKEKEAARKVEMEKRMKALKEAADAKARAEYAEKQHAIEEEARIARENHLIEVDNAHMQVEDALGHAMQQEMIAERERQRQIAAEQEEWLLFQEREEEKQREATQLRRAAMAQQYEQDKQRRIQIHKLQKERAAQQAERKELLSRQAQERQTQKAEVEAEQESAAELTNQATNIELDVPNEPVELPSAAPEVHKDVQEAKADGESLVLAVESSESEVIVANTVEETHVVADEAAPPQDSTASTEEEPKLLEPSEQEALNGKTDNLSVPLESEKLQDNTETTEEVVGPCVCDIPEEASNAESVVEVTANPDRNDPTDQPSDDKKSDQKKIDEESVAVLTHMDTADEPSAEASPRSTTEPEQKGVDRPVWSISAAREKGFVPFAQVLSVVVDSPAMQASLQSGDLLVEFGGIVSSTPKCLVAMAECVQKHVDTEFPVVLLRPVESTPENNFEELRVSLCPRKWKGKGLLGCQLSPFKWPEAEEVPQIIDTEVSVAMESSSSCDEGVSALVIYDILPESIAAEAGLVNGDTLAGCDHLENVNVSTLTAIVEHIKAARSSSSSVNLEINRWIAEDQCYRTLRVILSLSADSESLGLSLTSFAEYYNYYPSASTASACEECYYTTLTTALHAAALSGHVSCLEALLSSLQNGDEGGYTAIDYLDWRDEDGRTPLFYACYAGQLESVDYLVKLMQSVLNNQQPIVTGSDLYGDTVLHAATTGGNADVMTLLLESGCVKVDDKNHTRLTCAHVAPNVEILALLGEHWEADLLSTDSEERMPLAYACLRNDVDSIKYLCKKHPDFVDYADVRGNTPLHVAASLGLQEAAEVLIHFLPSIALYITNEDGQNAAELARSSAMDELADFLDSVFAAADSNEA